MHSETTSAVVPAVEVDKIKVALDALLSQMVAIDRKPRKGPATFKFISVADLDAEPIPTERQSQIEEVLESPVRAACRNAVRLLGERLFELTGDTDRMLEIAESLSKGRHGGLRASILDHAWDEIGDWHA